MGVWRGQFLWSHMQYTSACAMPPQRALTWQAAGRGAQFPNEQMPTSFSPFWLGGSGAAPRGTARAPWAPSRRRAADHHLLGGGGGGGAGPRGRNGPPALVPEARTRLAEAAPPAPPARQAPRASQRTQVIPHIPLAFRGDPQAARALVVMRGRQFFNPGQLEPTEPGN